MSRVAPIRALTRAGEHRRRTWSDRYISLFGLALLAVLALPVVGRAVAAVPGEVDPARAGAGLALVALLLAGALALARAVGPLGVSAADAAWLVLSPLPRRGVLAPALLILAGAAAVLGAAVGLALTGALGATDVAARLVVAVVLGVSWALAGAATAVLAQASQTWDGWVIALIAALVLAAAAAAVMSAGPGRGALGALAAAWTVAAGAWAAVAAALAWRAWAAAARIPARAVLAASDRVGLAVGAVVGLDPGALTRIAEDAHWRSRTLRSRPWPARLRGAAAVAWLDWRRLGRRPVLLAWAAAAAVPPALAARAGVGGAGVLFVLAAGAMAVAAAGTAGERRDAGDAALARLLGAGPRALAAARAVLPGLLGGAWLTLALAGLDLAGDGAPLWPLGVLCAPALAAGALRMARRRPVEHTAPVVDTPLGPVPLGPVQWALTGADLAVLGCLPALVAFAAGVSGPLLAAQAVAGAAVLTAHCAARR
ncbi:DUF6297 family protein [Nocardiopsis protaetiae]|uniref:DUF6297 family protein n=1 Tax=Nocardiopsis protaetiae TaxID=3382270 RepID=UPI00387AC018